MGRPWNCASGMAEGGRETLRRTGRSCFKIKSVHTDVRIHTRTQIDNDVSRHTSNIVCHYYDYVSYYFTRLRSFSARRFPLFFFSIISDNGTRFVKSLSDAWRPFAYAIQQCKNYLITRFISMRRHAIVADTFENIFVSNRFLRFYVLSNSNFLQRGTELIE